MADDTQALKWIVHVLVDLDIPFQAVGGLAARAYGATRPLADFDFYVPAARLEEIARATAPHVVRPPSRYRDEFWDLAFMKIEYGGQEIELAGAEGTRFFDRVADRWREAEIDLEASVECRVLGVAVPVMPVGQLVEYKTALGRDVDQQDLADMAAAQRKMNLVIHQATDHDAERTQEVHHSAGRGLCCGSDEPEVKHAADGRGPDVPRDGPPASRIAVVPYDSRWPHDFERAAAEIRTALTSTLLATHHIGSTTIPGIHAKPVIDMLAVVSDLHAVDQRTTDMQRLGYEVMGEFGIDGRRYFRRDDSIGRRTHQIHAFADGSPHVGRHLAFRDFLRAHPHVANEYSELKRRLAEAHPHDMDAYMDGKDAFIKETEARALAWIASSARSAPSSSPRHSPDSRVPEVAAPILTKRLRLRPWVAADRVPFAALNADPVVMEHFLSTLSRDESDALAERIETARQRRGFGFWAVEVPGVVPFAGFIGLSVPSFEGHFTPCVEIGWRLARQHWHQGLATEGATAALSYAFDVVQLPEVVAFTAPGNGRSRRVMEKLGMRHDRMGDFDHPLIPAGHPLRRHVLYRVRNPRYQ